MVWLKMSDDFGDQCAQAGLSDAAFRTHVEGLAWCMRRESGGQLSERDVRRFAESADAESAVQELVRVGFWTKTKGGYVVEHHMDEQVEPEVIARRRKLDAERQRRARLKRVGLGEDGAPPPAAKRESHRKTPSASRRDNTRDPGLGGSGLEPPPHYVAPKRRRGTAVMLTMSPGLPSHISVLLLIHCQDGRLTATTGNAENGQARDAIEILGHHDDNL
jgi:hypothetical protein